VNPRSMIKVGDFYKVFFANCNCIVLVKDITNQVEWWDDGMSSDKLSLLSTVEVVSGSVPKLFLGAEHFEIKCLFDAKGSVKKEFVIQHGILKYSATVVPLTAVECKRVRTMYNV